LSGQAVPGDGGALGGRAYAVSAGPGVELSSGLEAANCRLCVDGGACDVVAEEQRQFAGQDLLELRCTDRLGRRIEPGGLYPYEHVLLSRDELEDVRLL